MGTTLGIDLASQPKSTGICRIEWSPGAATVAGVWRGTDADGGPLDDRALLAAMLGRDGRDAPTKVGIDAPLGWPVAFVDALSGRGPWPGLGASRAPLERRATDFWVHEHAEKLPLSVSTDRIAYPAMRAAGLLAQLADEQGGAIDRTGVAGPVCETYPDPAIRRFGLWPTVLPSDGTVVAKRASYKGPAGRPIREAIVATLVEDVGWLDLSPADAERCVAFDDGLDALICALVARGVELGITTPPPAEHAVAAAREGWIHVPAQESLGLLVSTGG